MSAATPVAVGSGLLSCRDWMCMGLRQLLSNRVPRKRLPGDPVARLQYVYDKVLGYVASEDCTVHEVELLLYPGCARHSRQDPTPSPDPLPTGTAMLSTWPGGSASCCDVDVGEVGQLDSCGSVSGHIRSARFLTAGARPPLMPRSRSPREPRRRPHPVEPDPTLAVTRSLMRRGPATARSRSRLPRAPRTLELSHPLNQGQA